MNQLRKILFFCCINALVLPLFGQNSNYTISSLDGTAICLKRSDSTFTLRVKINAPASACKINKYKIIWGDGVEDTFNFDPNSTEHNHTYNFRPFISSCNISVRMNAEIETDNKNCQSNITPVYFYNEPKPDFVLPSQRCVGQLISFSGQMCPNSPTTKMFWEYGDNTSDSTGVHAYTKAGTYKVKLTVKNDCGQASVTKSITIIEEPKAVIADSGYVSTNNTLSNYCLKNGSVIVRLDGTKSISAKTYEWRISSNSGYQFIEKTNGTSPRPKLVFTTKGQYTVSLRVTSDCGLIDNITKTINIADLPNVTITPQPDVCQSINYKIDNYVDGANYVINTEPSATTLSKGQILSLSLRDTPYIVNATFSNVCGNITLADTFFVTTPKTVTITSFRDTTVCINSSALVLKTNITTGSWSSVPSSTITANKFNPTVAGTFTLTYTNGSGNCATSDKVTARVVSLPNLTLTPQPDVCQALDYTIANYIDGANYTINTDPTATTLLKNQKVTLALRNNAYIVQASYNNICGTISKADTFFVTAAKTVKITSFRDTTVCAGGKKLLLQTNVNTGTWTSSPSVSINNNEFNPSTAGIFTLTYTNGSGTCVTSDKVVARVVTSPNLTLTPQSDVCQELSYTIANYVDGATYTINTTPTATTLSKNQTLKLALRDNAYIVQATYQNECGPLAKADTFFVASPKAVKITAFRDTSICLSTKPLLLKAAQNGGTWSGDLVTGSSFSPDKLGRFFVLYATGQGACNIADTAYVTVKGTVISLSDKTVCGYDSIVKLQVSPSTGKWLINNCPTCKTSGDSLFITKTASTTVSLTYQVVKDGCTNTKDMTVTIAPTPKVAFTVSGQCIGSPLITSNTSTNTSSFQWFINNSFVSNNQTINPSNLPVGTHTFLLKGINGTCRDSLQKTIELFAPPQSISINSNTTEGCSPLDVSFTANGVQEKSVTYTWDFGNGQVTKDFKPTQQRFTTVPSVVKVYNVTLTSSNVCGTQKTSKDITVRTIPLADLGVDSTTLRCSPARILFSNRSVGANKPVTWQWGDGSNASVAQLDTITHLFSAKDTIQTYKVKLLTNNICGASQDSIDIQVYPSNVVALFQMSKSIVCPNESIIFTDATKPIPQRMIWKFGDGSSPVQGASPTHSFTTPNKSFTVTLISYTQCGYDSVQKTVQVKAAPTGDFSFPALNCAEQKVQFTNKSNINLYNALWNFGDGSPLDSANFSPKHLYATSGDKTVTLTLKDFITGCTTPISKTVTIREKVKAQFRVVGDSVLCSPAMVQLVNTSLNANTFEWVFSDGQKSSLASPALSFSTGRYTTTLTASFNNVCRDSITVVNAFVTDSCFALFPEVFTPNNDGIGDQYTLFGTGIKKIHNLKIRNRWNELIFERSDFVPNDNSMGWDGIYKNQPAPNGLYVYEAEIEFLGQKPKKMPPGHFYLVRKE